MVNTRNNHTAPENVALQPVASLAANWLLRAGSAAIGGLDRAAEEFRVAQSTRRQIARLKHAVISREADQTLQKAWSLYAETLTPSYLNRPPACEAEPLYLSWGAPWPNFGDGLSPLVVHLLSGRPIRGRNFAHDLPSPKLIALGSILDRARDGDTIWGTGFRNFPVQARQLDIRAVRGPLTREYLLERGFDCPAVYGDPAQLLPYFFCPEVKKIYDVGVISHFSDYSALRSLRGDSIVRIDIMRSPLDVVRQILSCHNILSSSLHGLIVAEAYGIPACWMRPASYGWRYEEPDFKYNDYYKATNREPTNYQFGWRLNLNHALKIAASNQRPRYDDQSLLTSFPCLRPGLSTLNDLMKFQITDDGINFPTRDGALS